MLPARARLHRAADFTEVLRAGRRAGRPLLSATLLLAASGEPETLPARAGLVVSKAVGGSVVRHRTARRLRGLLTTRLGALPAGARLVVRAHATAGTASSAELAADLDRALSRVLAPARTNAGGVDR